MVFAAWDFLPYSLVHVAAADPTTSPYETPLGVEYAETVLRQADAAIRATGKDLKVDTAELVIVGSDDAGRVADIVGPHSHPLFEHPESSVLVVRHRGPAPPSNGPKDPTRRACRGRP